LAISSSAAAAVVGAGIRWARHCRALKRIGSVCLSPAPQGESGAGPSRRPLAREPARSVGAIA